MPSSQRSSCKSADESSLSGRSTKYIDIDIKSDMVSKAEGWQRPYSRSDDRPQSPGRSESMELHLDLQIEVGDRRFYLDRPPLLSKCGRLNGLVFEAHDTENDRIVLSDIPGGAPAFESIARHLYGARVELSPHNVAAIRCAAEYLEISGDNSNLVTRAEDYLNHQVTESWRDSITVLKCCSELHPWADDLEIVRRCSEWIAWKCCDARKGRGSDWWFDDICSLSIDAFGSVIRAVTAMGYSGLVASAVGYYAEKWLHLTKGSDMSTTLKLTTKESESSSQAASFMAFTGFNQDIVAKDAKQTQHKNRAVLQGIVNLLPMCTTVATSMSVKFLFKLLRVAFAVNAGSFCKTDLAKRIASQLEKASVNDLLIPAAAATGESSAYDTDIVRQIVEFYIQGQSWENSHSAPLSPRSSVSGASTSSSDLSDSSITSSDSSVTSGSSVSVERRSRRNICSLSGSGTESSTSSSFRSSSDTGSSISGSSSNLSISFRSTSSESSSTSVDASSESSSSSRSSVSDVSSDESVKLEKKDAFYVTENRPSRKTLLPRSTANFKVAQLLETYLEEIAKDSSIAFGQFMQLAELFTEFPRDSDDSIYRTIDGFLWAHPSLTETDRKCLCRLMDPGALSLAGCMHAASNERLPLRVIVQLLFSEQIKIRNEMTGNDVINEKDLDSALPSFSTSTTSSSSSSTTTTTESSSDAISDTSSSASRSSTGASSSPPRPSRHIRSISSASTLNQLAMATRRSPSVASSPLLGGLSVKGTLRFVLAEIESLRKSVQEIETVKNRLNVMEALQPEMEYLSSKFQEMSHDYVGMTQQVEELTKGSKNTKSSGWNSGWKKVTKSFQSKDNHDHKNETPPLPPVKLHPSDFPELPVLRSFKSDTLHPTTPRAADPSSVQTKTTARADSLPVPKTKTKTESATLHPKTPSVDSLPPVIVMPVTTALKSVRDLPGNPKRRTAVDPRTPFQTPRDSFKMTGQEIVVTSEAAIPSNLKRGNGTAVQTPRNSIMVTGQELVMKSEATTLSSSGLVKGKEGYVITSQRSHHHVEEVQRRSVRSRSTSPDYVRSRHYEDSNSVTSTSSTSSTTSSNRGGHQYRRNGRNGDSLGKHHSRGHRADKSGRSVEHHGPSHRKYRQKEGSHTGGQSQRSGDSHPARHSSATTPSRSQHSGHQLYSKSGSVGSHHTGSEHHSGSHRSGHRHKDRHKEHHSHRRSQSFSDDSGASSDFVAPRRRHHRT